MNGSPSELGLFVGRFHPVLVHLPIGLIILVALLEVMARWPRFQHARAANGIILALAVPASAFSALCGWLLSRGGGYDAQLLDWHMWLGFAVAASSLMALAFHWLEWRRTYLAWLAGLFILLAVASHGGGSLTHGSDYLTRYAPGVLRDWLGSGNKDSAISTNKEVKDSVFAKAVLPVFERSCANCHGPEKAKADLRLDSWEAITKGGEAGPVLQPGQSAASLLVKRLLLPPSHEDHMPPEGKPQPSADEIALLQWWIDAGAPRDKSAGELKPPPNVQRILQARNPVPPAAGTAPSADNSPRPQSEVLPLVEKLAEDLGVALSPLSSTEPWLQCNASLAKTNFGDAELAKLAPLAKNLRWLDLADTRVTDEGLAQVGAMKNLTRLHVERTAITDAGLAHLSGLNELEYLNLYGTPITDEGLPQLKPLARLRQLYLWQTQVSSNAAQSFAQATVDKEQIQRWQAEIAALKTKIKSQGMVVDIGSPVVAKRPKPINEKCPVSDKDIDPAKTTLHGTNLVAFCCDKCKAAFEKDPQPCLAKLGLTVPAKDAPSSSKP